MWGMLDFYIIHTCLTAIFLLSGEFLKMIISVVQVENISPSYQKICSIKNHSDSRFFKRHNILSICRVIET